MHLFIFVRLAFSTGGQQSQVLLLFAVPQLSCVYLMSHFLLVTYLCRLQNSHTSLGPNDWVEGGFFVVFFPLAESFEITGRKFRKPVLLLLWISDKRSNLSDVDIITVAICLQKPTFTLCRKEPDTAETDEDDTVDLLHSVVKSDKKRTSCVPDCVGRQKTITPFSLVLI